MRENGMDLEMEGDDTWKSTHSYKAPNTPNTESIV